MEVKKYDEIQMKLLLNLNEKNSHFAINKYKKKSI